MSEKNNIELSVTGVNEVDGLPRYDNLHPTADSQPADDEVFTGPVTTASNEIVVTPPSPTRNKSTARASKKAKPSIKRLFSRKSSRRGSDQGPETLADYLLSPTHPSHLGVFKFMPFEHEEVDDTKPIHESTQDDEVPLTTKEKLRHILHSKALHLVIIFLVLLDSILVVLELLFDLRVIGPMEGESVIREVFHGFSVGILSMFMIELVLKLWADHKHFIRHKIEVLDGFVVVVSWVVDIALVFINSTSLLALELILLLRLWRVFRIVNGIIVAVKTKADERVHFFKLQNKELLIKLDKAQAEIKALKNDIGILNEALLKHGIRINETKVE